MDTSRLQVMNTSARAAFGRLRASEYSRVIVILLLNGSGGLRSPTCGASAAHTASALRWAARVDRWCMADQCRVEGSMAVRPPLKTARRRGWMRTPRLVSAQRRPTAAF